MIGDNIRALLAKAFRWWRTPAPPSVCVETVSPPSVPAAPQPINVKHEPAQPLNLRGVFTFRKTILNDLEGYFDFIARLKVADKSAYHMYSKVGAAIVPRDTVFQCGELPARWRAGARPTFGCLSIVLDKDKVQPDDPMLKLRFGYFERWDKPPAAVQRMKGTTYSLTMFIALDDLDRNVPRGISKRYGFGVPLEMWVCVSPDGTHVSPLKTREQLAPKGIPQTLWRVHPYYVDAAKRCNETVDQWMSKTFCTIVGGWENSALDVLVRVKRGDLCAMFCIDMLRTPYFFHDRDATAVTASGKRRPIFHIVRTHQRTSGKFVRTHFRGLRKFTWNGYDVNITLPGLHHANLHELEVGSLAEDQVARRRQGDLIGPKRFGRKLARYLDAA